MGTLGGKTWISSIITVEILLFLSALAGLTALMTFPPSTTRLDFVERIRKVHSV